MKRCVIEVLQPRLNVLARSCEARRNTSTFKDQRTFSTLQPPNEDRKDKCLPSSELLDNPNRTRYKLTIQYDGSHYKGWARNGMERMTRAGSRKSVQESIEVALCRLFPSVNEADIKVVGSGRTDSGVHALGQVAHVDLPFLQSRTKEQCETIQQGLFHFLAKEDEQVSILKVEAVPSTFHARFSATSRTYIYRLFLGQKISCPLFQRNYCWSVPQLPFLERLQSSCSVFLGTHDFSTFRASDCGSNTPLRTITECSFQEVENPCFGFGISPQFEGKFYQFSFRANAFLYTQVRSMVGLLKTIGEGKLTKEDAERLLVAKDRSALEVPLAPPEGLFLAQVHY